MSQFLNTLVSDPAHFFGACFFLGLIVAGIAITIGAFQNLVTHTIAAIRIPYQTVPDNEEETTGDAKTR